MKREFETAPALSEETTTEAIGSLGRESRSRRYATAIMFAAQLTDSLTTSLVFQVAGSRAWEANPLMAYTIEHTGVFGPAPVKLLGTLLFLGLVHYGRARWGDTGAHALLRGMNLATTAASVHNVLTAYLAAS